MASADCIVSGTPPSLFVITDTCDWIRPDWRGEAEPLGETIFPLNLGWKTKSCSRFCNWLVGYWWEFYCKLIAASLFESCFGIILCIIKLINK